MADRTHIEWTDATWNPITGCSVVSAGCKHCYAMKLAGTRLAHHPSRAGLTQETAAGPVWTGEVRFNAGWLDQPLRWQKPRRIFVCAHSDLFHENVPSDWIDQVFAVMARARRHTFQVLTKRPERMLAYLARAEMELRDTLKYDEDAHTVEWPLPNVWIGVSVEDQKAADTRIPMLLQTPAAVRWLSCEPLLGPVNLQAWLARGAGPDHGFSDRFGHRGRLHWVVAGGEAGTGSRPMHPDWVRAVRDDCELFGVPFLFKQWGDWKAVYDRDRDDPDWRRCGEVERQYPHYGRWLNLAGGHGFHGERVHYVTRVGKALAGRYLDDALHDAYPAPTIPADTLDDLTFDSAALAQIGTA